MIKTITITFLFYGFFMPVNAQFTLTAIDEAGMLIVDKKIKISQGSLNLERFTDSLGVLELQTHLFDTTKLIELKPDGFKVKNINFENQSLRVKFTKNFNQLDEILLYEQRQKQITFKNHKHKNNRLKGFLKSSKDILGDILFGTENITHIPEFTKDKKYGLVHSISFVVRNRNPKDDRSVVYRLNLYDDKKDLIFSMDKKFIISEIDKSLDFDIPPDLINKKEINYIGIKNINVALNTPPNLTPEYQIMFMQSEFQTAKTNIVFFSEDNLEWQLISTENKELDGRIMHLLTQVPELSEPYNNWNLNINITCEKASPK